MVYSKYAFQTSRFAMNFSSTKDNSRQLANLVAHPHGDTSAIHSLVCDDPEACKKERVNMVDNVQKVQILDSDKMATAT